MKKIIREGTRKKQKKKPVLSFLNVERVSSIWPLGSTASNPTTFPEKKEEK